MTETVKIDALAPLSWDNRFGSALAVSGQWMIAGAPGNALLAEGAGAVYMIRQDNGTWNVVQTLVSPDGTTSPQGDGFGFSVDIANDLAIVGSRREQVDAVSNAGAVHIYQFDGNSWIHLVRLVASDPLAYSSFGSSIAMDGDLIVVGAPNDNDQGANSGSAYIFRRTADTWIQETKLTAPNGAANDNFGDFVDVSDGVVLIGAPLGGPADTGAAHVFEYVGGAWTHQQQLLAPNGVTGDRFGDAVVIDSDRLVVGAPYFSLPIASAGAAYAFAHDGFNWSLTQQIQASDPDYWALFGSSFAIDDDRLVIGANRKRFYFGSGVGSAWNAGAGYLFEFDSELWVEQFQMRRLHIPVSLDSQIIENDFLGASAAFAGDSIALGAPMHLDYAVEEQGAIFFFDQSHPDCDVNGLPDVCESDCNGDLIADPCQLMNNTVADCNGNQVPDECDAGFTYVLDDGECPCTVYGPGQCPVPDRDFIWLNQFNVVPGGQRISHVAVSWASWAGEGRPVTLLLYDDPNNDGDPSDAVLLATSPGVTHDAFGLPMDLRFTSYAMPNTSAGQVGESFFVGVHMSLPCDVFAATLETTPPNPFRSWLAKAPYGQGNINNLAANTSLTQFGGKWAVRAVALDCDGNGTWDQCDIDADPSLDLNANGILDTCDIPCPGDIAGGDGKITQRDGAVNIDDLLVVISRWDETGPPGTVPGDIAPDWSGGDGVVNIDDLLVIINGWGPCP